MRNVVVDKQELYQIVCKNRDSHRELFLKAQEGYRTKVIEELDKMLDEARRGLSIRRSITFPEPMDHTKDYDRVIRMIEMSVDDVIQLDADSFDQYILDNWSWKHLTDTVNMSYVS